MIQRVLSASAYNRLVKRYPLIRAFVVVAGVVRWLVGRRQRRNDRLQMVDVDLADDEILVLTREKVRQSNV